MLVIDRLLVKGIRFCLDKVIQAVDQEMNDVSSLREQLLAAQMRFELGEISQDELAAVETEIMGRLREIADQQGGGAIEMGGARAGDEELKVTGVEATFGGDDEGLQALAREESPEKP